MKKKNLSLKSLKLDKSHLLNLNADIQGIQGGNNSIIKEPIKKTFPTTTNDPTLATFCFFCPPQQSQELLCL